MKVNPKAASTNPLCFCRELFCSFCCLPFLRMFLICSQNILFLAHGSLEHLCMVTCLSLSILCQQVPWNLAPAQGLGTAGLTGACECRDLSSAMPPLPRRVCEPRCFSGSWPLGMWKHCHTIWLFSPAPFGNIIPGG